MFVRIGMKNIEREILKLSDYAANGLTARGYRIVSPRGEGETSGIVAFEVEDEDTATTIQRLTAENKILISRHDRVMRVAPHFFNDEQELDTFFAVLPRRR
jgi:cysteine desulfurase / selenocysteine lyase